MNIITAAGIALICSVALAAVWHAAQERLLRKAAELCRFVNQLGLAPGRGDHPATFAYECDPDASWEAHLGPLREVVVACGAKWTRDGEGRWYILETNGAEKETAVRELLECFGFPTGFRLASGLKQSVYIERLTALHELGLPLPMEQLKRTEKAQTAKPQPQAPLATPNSGAKAEDATRQQQRQGADGAHRPVERF
jgi:hypothetical protein